MTKRLRVTLVSKASDQTDLSSAHADVPMLISSVPILTSPVPMLLLNTADLDCRTADLDWSEDIDNLSRQCSMRAQLSRSMRAV